MPVNKLRAIETFVSIADEGTLTAASRALGISLPVVVRALASLEAELSVRLFNRTTRKVALTEEGRRYLEHCRQVLVAMDEADQAVTRNATVPRGRLTVTAPVLFGRLHVAPAVTGFLRKYPQMTVRLMLLDRVVNLLEEGIDVGVRIGTLADSTQVAQKLGVVRRVLAASPAFIRQHGTPTHPRDLCGLNCLSFVGTAPQWTFYRRGKPLSVAVRGNLHVNHVAPLVDACTAGLGVGRFFSYQVAPAVRARKLKLVLQEFEPVPQPIHVLFSQARLLPTRTRVFVDWIREQLAPFSEHG